MKDCEDRQLNFAKRRFGEAYLRGLTYPGRKTLKHVVTEKISSYDRKL